MVKNIKIKGLAIDVEIGWHCLEKESLWFDNEEK